MFFRVISWIRFLHEEGDPRSNTKEHEETLTPNSRLPTPDFIKGDWIGDCTPRLTKIVFPVQSVTMLAGTR